MSRLNFLLKNFGDKIEQRKARDTFATHMDCEEILKKMKDSDPTGGKCMQWVLSRYLDGDFRMEDMVRVRKVLENFKEKKEGLVSKDINAYGSLLDLESVVDDSPVVISNKKKVQELKKDGTKVIVESDDGKVIQILTQEAATYYGKGTRWCTSGENGNMFDSYASRGPIYLVLANNGRKIQFQIEDSQYMDETDSPVDLLESLKNYPVLLKFFMTKIDDTKKEYEKGEETLEQIQNPSFLALSLLKELSRKHSLSTIKDAMGSQTFKYLEDIILENSQATFLYAIDIYKDGDERFERTFQKDTWHGVPCAYLYHVKVLNMKPLKYIHDEFISNSGFSGGDHCLDFINMYKNNIKGD